jgi:putative hydrolase of the HAD superfamily
LYGSIACVTRALLIDVGGVLAVMSGLEQAWSSRLGLSEREFLSALYGGSDETVLIGAMDEAHWWRIVAGRLGVTADVIAQMHQDMAARETWDTALVALLRDLRGSVPTAIVSNAWPGARSRFARDGMLDLVDEIVVSAEVGCAKPDPRIFAIALERLGAEPADALFVDDTPGHVAAAQALGIAGHVHTGTAGTIAAIRDFLSRRRPVGRPPRRRSRRPR